jgi:hypothetical protein
MQARFKVSSSKQIGTWWNLVIEAAVLQTCKLVTEVQFTAKEVIGVIPVVILLDFYLKKDLQDVTAKSQRLLLRTM